MEEEGRRADAERIAGEQRATAEMEGGEGSKEADKATGVMETTGESWEDEMAQLQAAAKGWLEGWRRGVPGDRGDMLELPALEIGM